MTRHVLNPSLYTLHVSTGSDGPQARIYEGPVSKIGPAVMAAVEAHGHKVHLVERWTCEGVVELVYRVTPVGEHETVTHHFLRPDEPWPMAGDLP